MYTSNTRNGHTSKYYSEKVELPPLPPPPPVPAHFTPSQLPSTMTSVETTSSPASQLMRCVSLPHGGSNQSIPVTSPNIPARPMSWHPVPSRRTSRFYQNDPEIKAKLDRIAHSDRLIAIRNRLFATIE